MTDIVPSGAPAIVGFEDFNPATDQSERKLRLRIGQDDSGKGAFVSNDDGWEPDANISVIMLGLVKQRILWPEAVGEGGEGPLCRSYDFAQGIPNPDAFDYGTFQPAAEEYASKLSCSTCVAKEWGSHPSRDTSFCTEQFVFPSLVIDNTDGSERQAFLTFQRSGLKATKAYMGSYARSNTPMFAYETELALEPQKRGSVRYSTPKFTRGAPTDEDRAQELATLYLDLRAYISTPPPTQDAVDVDVEVVASRGADAVAAVFGDGEAGF